MMYLDSKTPKDKIHRYKFVSSINMRIKTLIDKKGWRYRIEVTEYWIEKEKAFDLQYYGGLKYKIHDDENPRAKETWNIWIHGRRTLELNKVYSLGFAYGFENDYKDHESIIVNKAMHRANDINTKVSYKSPYNPDEWVDSERR